MPALPPHLASLLAPLESNTYLPACFKFLLPLCALLLLLFFWSPAALTTKFTRVLSLNWTTFAVSSAYNLLLPEASQAMWQYQISPTGDCNPVFRSMVSSCQAYIAIVSFGATTIPDAAARRTILLYNAYGMLFMSTLGVWSDLGDPLGLMERWCGGSIDYGLMTYAAGLMGLLMLAECHVHAPLSGGSQGSKPSKQQ
jgi:hypothetical protein